MIALPLSILALAAGVYLLVKVKREFLGKIFEILAWLVIVLSLVSVGFSGFKGLHHCGGDKCKQGSECRVEKEVIIKDGKGTCSMESTSSMTCCKTEGDSMVMEKEMCEKMMGKEGCEKMTKERGRCIMSKEECAKVCEAAGHSCGAQKSAGGCSMHGANCKGDCAGKCSGKCGGTCETGKKECCVKGAEGEKKECCKKK